MLYIKKPTTVKAVQFLMGNNTSECLSFCDKLKYNPYMNKYIIETPEGNMIVSDRDYIVQGINGEFYLVKEDIFLKTYERKGE